MPSGIDNRALAATATLGKRNSEPGSTATVAPFNSPSKGSENMPDQQTRRGAAGLRDNAQHHFSQRRGRRSAMQGRNISLMLTLLKAMRGWRTVFEVRLREVRGAKLAARYESKRQSRNRTHRADWNISPPPISLKAPRGYATAIAVRLEEVREAGWTTCIPMQSNSCSLSPIEMLNRRPRRRS